MAVRTWLVRRLMGRLRITDDIVRHLSSLQRLGEAVEVEMPGELLPVGARTVFRAVRTRAAAQLGPDWVWPYWLHTQIDPAHAEFIPRGHLAVLTNVTSRNWTAIGNPSSPNKAIVDPRGLVTPWFDGWSLDWWVHDGEQWRFPSSDDHVRQAPLDNGPVVKTSMPTGNGEVIQRAYAVGPQQDLEEFDDEEYVVVEIENTSASPTEVALAIRPYNPEGLAVVERIALHERIATVDGRPAILFHEPPARMAAREFAEGDSAHLVTSGRTVSEFPEAIRCEAGLAQAAFVFDIAGGTTFSVALPLTAPRRTRRRGLARRRAEKQPRLPDRLPAATQVADEWKELVSKGATIELPPGRIADSFEANRRYMLLFHEGEDATPGPYTYHRFWFRDAAYILQALGRLGEHERVAQVLRTYPKRQHFDGFFFSQRQEWDSNGAALWSMGEHWRLSADKVLIDELAQTVSRGVRWIERKRRSKRRRRDEVLKGLLPASISAEHLGPFDYFYWDSFWSLRGLLDGADLLRVAGRSAAADVAQEWAAGLRNDLEHSMSMVADRLETLAIPAGPRRRLDPGVIGSLAACYPLRVLAATSPQIAATAEVVRERFCRGPAFFQSISHTGLGTYLTLQLAFVELEAGDRRALDRLNWMIDAAMPTFTWPEAIHPRLGGGCMGDGHHGWAASDFVSFVRELLVREVEGGLELFTLFPDEWRGHRLVLRDLPTHHGKLSVALDWRADRAYLRWSLIPHEHVTGPLTLRAPGLDPGWSSAELNGEAYVQGGLASVS